MLCLNQMEIKENFKLVDHSFRKNTNSFMKTKKADFDIDVDDDDDDDDASNEQKNAKVFKNKLNGLKLNRICTTNTEELKSILNYCEEQIKENDEYKRAAMRRSASVKVPANITANGSTNSMNKNEQNGNNGKKPEKKVVRFADALGLDLVSVKMILNPDRPPRIPKHILKVFRDATKFSDDDCDDDDDYNDDDYDDVDCFYYKNQFNDFNNNNNGKNGYQSLFSPSIKPLTKSTNTPLSSTPAQNTFRRYNGIVDDSFQISNFKYKLKWRQQFEQPAIKPDFYVKLNDKKVSLETIHTKSSTISGVVRVSNICYNKFVKIRYTVDNWCTHTDVNASYIDNSFDGFTDRFSFTLNLENSLVEFFNKNPSSSIFKIQFAILYETKPNDYEFYSYWDNNYGTNYIVESISCNNQDDIIISPTQSTDDLIAGLSNNLSAAFV